MSKRHKNLMTESSRERAADAGVSEETLKVLENIRKDGEVFEGVDPTPKAPKEPEQPIEVVVETKEPEQVKEEVKTESKPIQRTPNYVPVGKFNELRHEFGETKAQLEAERQSKRELEQAKSDLEKKLSEISNNPQQESDDVRNIATSLAEKHGIDQSLVEDLLKETLSVSSKNAKSIPDDILKTISELKAQAEKVKEIEQKDVQDKWFETTFSTEITKEFPELDNPKAKSDLKQLAFTEGNETMSLRSLAIEYAFENKPKVNAEAPGTGRTPTIDYENITEDDLEKMSRAETAKFLDWQKKKNDYRSISN